MRNEFLILTCSMAVGACALEEPEREATNESEAESDAVDDGDGDGDGDADGESHNAGAQGHAPDPICDMSGFPQLELEWVDLTPSLIPEALPAVMDLDVTESEIFATGIHDIDNIQHQRGFIERRELDGTLDWLVEISDVRGIATIWDGEHLYGVFDDEVRRWTVNGVSDDWSAPASSFVDLAIGETTVAVATNDEQYAPDQLDPSNSNTAYVAYRKSLPLSKHSLGKWAAPDLDHRTQAIVEAPWGEWVAAVASDDPVDGPLFLAEFGEHGIHARLDVDRDSRVVAMLAPLNALLVFGQAEAKPAWVIGVSHEGEELWRKQHSLCPGADGALVDVIDRKGALWALAWVRTNHNKPAYLLVRFGLSGQLISAQAIPIASKYFGLHALDVTATQAYVGGWISDGVDRQRVIGRIDF